jgi:hypothetical protein
MESAVTQERYVVMARVAMNVAQIIVVEKINIVVGEKNAVMLMKSVAGVSMEWVVLIITVIHPAGMRSQT